jgi:hypothetical protein
MLAPSGLAGTAGCEPDFTAAWAKAAFGDDRGACGFGVRSALALLEISRSPESLNLQFGSFPVKTPKVFWSQALKDCVARKPGAD